MADATVTVYNFKMPSGRDGHRSTHKATAEAIANMGAEILPDTEQDVPADQVDDSGFWSQSKWGELS